MTRKLVNIGDGRVIEMKEEVAVKAAPPKPKKDPSLKKRKKPGKPTKRKNTAKARFLQKGLNRMKETVPGFAEWCLLQRLETHRFFNKPGLTERRRFGTPNGMTPRQAAWHWGEAKRKAKDDMATLEKAGLLPDDELVREATEYTLTIMRGPMNQDMGLRAARQILEWYKSKPVSRSETTINAAEAFLAGLAEPTPKSD
jgi:hypothetical protein